jgi:hypothetical protein
LPYDYLQQPEPDARFVLTPRARDVLARAEQEARRGHRVTCSVCGRERASGCTCEHGTFLF